MESKYRRIHLSFSQKGVRGILMDRVNQRTNHLLGENIRKLRLEKNIRNKDIVAQLQVHGVEISTGTYSKVELGLNNPSVDLLIALTDILDCDFNAFFKIEKK